MAPAIPVNHPRNGLLTATVRTENHDGAFRLRNAASYTFRLKHRGAAPFKHFSLTAPKRWPSPKSAKHCQQLLLINGFRKIVRCARLDGAYSIRYRRVFRHYHKGNIPLLTSRPLQQADTVTRGKTDISKHHSHVMFTNETAGRRFICSGHHVITGFQKPFLQDAAKKQIILNQ